MAQAILLKDVDTLGERGAVIDVSPGYLRNFLVPHKLAQPATGCHCGVPPRGGRGLSPPRPRPPRLRRLPRCCTRPCSQSRTRRATTVGCSAPSPPVIVDAIRQARGVRLEKRRVRRRANQDHGHARVGVKVADGVTTEIKTVSS